MKNASKTLTTLSKLRRQSSEPQATPTVVEYHPNEVDDLTPLKPEEVDECQLAELFQDHDFSFLFESPAKEASNQSVVGRKRKASSSALHEIPASAEENGSTSERRYTSSCGGSKRMRL